MVGNGQYLYPCVYMCVCVCVCVCVCECVCVCVCMCVVTLCKASRPCQSLILFIGPEWKYGKAINLHLDTEEVSMFFPISMINFLFEGWGWPVRLPQCL